MLLAKRFRKQSLPKRLAPYQDGGGMLPYLRLNELENALAAFEAAGAIIPRASLTRKGILRCAACILMNQTAGSDRARKQQPL